MAQKKRSAAPQEKKKPASGKVVRSRPQPVDEFSAAGGVPTVPRGLPGADFSQGKQAVHELSWGDFDRQVQALARAAKAFKPEAVVGLAHGGVFVGGAIASALGAEFFPVRVTRRSRDHAGGGARVADDLPRELAGKRVLVVDDIASSGDAIEFAFRLARERGVKALKSAALVARPDRYEPDYVAFTSADFFVFPWDYQDVVEDRRFDTGEYQVPAAAPRAPR